VQKFIERESIIFFYGYLHGYNRASMI